MRLTELDPVWIIQDGHRIGFTFICPTDSRWRQSCFAVATPLHKQLELFQKLHGDPSVQPCNQGIAWRIEGGIKAATFETMTVTPSIDGSAGGLWHGHITNGEIR